MMLNMLENKMNRFEELKNKKPEPLLTISKRGTDCTAKKIEANHTYHPILKGNRYSCLFEGSDFYTVKCRGQAINIYKWIFDSPPIRIPVWLQETEEEEEDY